MTPSAMANVPPAPELPGVKPVYSGKVRDLYENPDEPGRMLVVASDRVSAFDHVLEPGIPGKGALLTRLSLWWFAQLDVPNHLHLVYHFGVNHCRIVVKRGRVVVEEGAIAGTAWGPPSGNGAVDKPSGGFRH